ncbi:Nucleoporin p58/p45, partial [Quaeritorhiza haematococci]
MLLEFPLTCVCARLRLPSSLSSFSFGTPAPAAGGGFSFGAPAASTPATTAAASSFGFGASTTPSFSFGAGATTAAATPAATSAPAGFSFGAPATTGAPAASAPGSSLFGAPTLTTIAAGATTAAPATTSLFGAPTTAAPGTTSLFGASTTKAPGTTSLFGTTQPAAGTTAGALGAASLSVQNITKTTRYSELPENVRAQLDELERYIQSQIQTSEHIASSPTPFAIRGIMAETSELSRKLSAAKTLLTRDTYLIDSFKRQVAQEMRHVDVATRFVDRYSAKGPLGPGGQLLQGYQLQGLQGQRGSPMGGAGRGSFYQQGMYGGGVRGGYGYANGGQSETAQYFFNLANTLEERIQQYRQAIDELERYLVSVTQQQSQFTPQMIQETLRAQNDSFLALANRIAALHDEIDSQRDAFVDYRRRYCGGGADEGSVGGGVVFEAAKKGMWKGKGGK